MIIRIAGHVLAGLALLAFVAPTSADASETPHPLVLSMSETGPWATSLTTPLFDPTMRWVPGDTVTSGFWAANRSDDTTEFRITLLPWEQSLMNSGEFDLRVRSGDDRWEPIRSAWTAPRPLAAGEKMHVQLRASLPTSASNATQSLAFGFDVRTRLTYQGPVVAPTPTATPPQADTGVGDPGDDARDGEGAAAKHDDEQPSPHRGALAGTGADQAAWFAPVGLGALLTGLWLALIARRRSDEESDVA